MKLRAAKRWIKWGEKSAQTLTFRLPFHVDSYLYISVGVGLPLSF